jgi:tetratricopeptide (TPR) repeat protein
VPGRAETKFRPWRAPSLGDVLSAQGDLPAALKSFQNSYVISQRRAHADPTNPIYQSNLYDDLVEIGIVLTKQGDLPGALKVFRDSLATVQRPGQDWHALDRTLGVDIGKWANRRFGEAWSTSPDDYPIDIEDRNEHLPLFASWAMYERKIEGR